jgi:SAM-dependent methyltransferase
MSESIEEQRNFYNERWAEGNYINRLKLERCIAILESLKSLPVTRPEIIDLGCGAGWLTSILAHVGPTVGVDLSDLAIEAARAKYPAVKFIQADLTHWDHAPLGSFDVVISQETIEHFADQRQYLDLANKLLRPHGYLILTTPNARTFAAMREDQQQTWSDQPIENLLDGKKLRQLVEPYFEVLMLRTIVPAYGSKGIYRFFSSRRIKTFSKLLHLDGVLNLLRLRLGLGLHFVLVGRKRLRLSSP